MDAVTVAKQAELPQAGDGLSNLPGWMTETRRLSLTERTYTETH
jgi:hypothetical protein